MQRPQVLSPISYSFVLGPSTFVCEKVTPYPDKPKLLDRVRGEIYRRNYSRRTAKSKDVEFTRREITVRDGKGNKDRVTLLPSRIVEPLAARIEGIRRQHEEDLRLGTGSVELHRAIERKYPKAPWEWGWQWVFPATCFYLDPSSGRKRRHHLHESVLWKAVGGARGVSG